MERDEILMALARLQSIQEELLRGFKEHKDLQQEMHRNNTLRMDALESDVSAIKQNINYAIAVVTTGGAIFLFFSDWIKTKLGFGT